MSNVAYIKQQAIEIANNSSHRIIIGVMNHKDSDADCSAMKDDVSEYYDDSFDSCLSSRYDRIVRRNRRKAERLARRSSY